MKKSIFTLIGIFLSVMVFSQTIVFQENFEGSTIGFTSSSVKNNNAWATTTTLQSQGLKSDSATVALSDTTYLTSNTFSCANMSFVQLEFDHIAKIDYMDAAQIQVSVDNGVSWTTLTSSQYLGSGIMLYGTNFMSGSYSTLWQSSVPGAQPDSTWWKHETFNLSSIAADSSQVKIRFALIDLNNNGASSNYGWLIDSVKVTASFSELIPPTITIIPPYPHDTAYTSGPFDVIAGIIDNTGIDTAVVIYSTTTGVTDTLGMNMIAQDTFKASIPFYGYGRSITYYVKAIDSSPAHNTDSVGPYTFFCKYSPGGTFVVGTGTNNNSTTSYPCVFGQWYTGDREQFLITAAELQAIGAVGGSITSIAWDVVTANSATSAGHNHDNFTIKMKNTTATSLTSSFETGLTQVYTTSTYQTVTGWNTFTLTTPFVWDGVSNLLIETCFDNYQGAASYSQNAIVNRTTTSFNSASYFRSDGGGVCSNPSATTTSSRPNIKMAMATPSNITNDIGVHQITNPTGGVVANQSFPIKVKVKNYGVDTITYGEIKWKFDGVLQNTYTFTDTILPDSLTQEFILGSKTVSAGAHHIITWTENPDSVADFNFANDSAKIDFYACPNLLNGTYTIGGTSADYNTFSDAVLALNQCGINGPVTFNIAAGTYNEHISLLPINGASATNTVVFQAANGDSSSVILTYDAAGTVDNYVIKLDGTSYITFKNMTIQATDTNYCNAVVLSGICHDVTIKNSVIKATIPQTSDNQNGYLVATLDSIGGNITIKQNAFYGGSRAVQLFSNTERTGWLIENNNFNGQYAQGVRLLKGSAAEVYDNSFVMDSATAEYQGIVLNNCNGFSKIYNNTIRATQSLIGYGIIAAQSEFDTLNHARIYNNMILLNGNSSSNTLSCGILINNAANIDVYYNTVKMTGNQTLATSMCMFDQGTTPNSDNINIANNIFTNTAGGYVYYIQSVDSSEFTNDYNFTYNWGQGHLGRLNGFIINDLAVWKTKTGEATHSDTLDPYFMGASDLHIANNMLNGRAIPVTGITTDIDGDTRNTTTPDPGADEFTPSPYDAATLEILAPADGCGLDTNETVIVRFKNVGSATINGNFTGSYQIVGNSTVITENITDTIAPGDTLDYAFSTKANFSVAATGSDSTFTVRAWCLLSGDNVHQNDTTQGDVESGYVPGLVTVADDTIQYGDKDTLYASGNNIYWWETDTSTTELANDTMFITPNLYDTTTFWVSDRAGSGMQSIQIGTSTQTNSSTGYNPFGQFYTGNKEQFLILASELQAAGASGGAITSVSFNVTSVNGPTSSGSNHDNFTIKLKNTSISATTTTFETGLTQVYTVPSYQTVQGWNTFNFTTPFIWDGTSNIIVETCFDNGTSNYSNNATIQKTNTTFNSVTYKYSDGSNNECMEVTGSTNTSRPNIKFSVAGQGCYGDRSPVTVYVTGFPQYDAGLDSNLVSPIGSIPSGNNAIVKGVLHNYGQVTLTSVKIPWELNGVVQDTMLWTGNLTYGNVDTVVIDTFNPGGGLYTVRAYTTLPNNVVDTFNTNDTAVSHFNSCLHGTYTIGDTVNGNADFGSFNGAVAALINAGICGNVVFNVDSGTYTEQLIIPEITGMDANNTVTFQSTTGDSTSVILKYSPTSYSYAFVLKLNGGDYFTFKNITIKSQGSYPGVVEIGNNSTHNSFYNNIIDMPVTTTSYARGFYSSGSNDNYTTIQNNHIKNGYYGVYMRGASSASLEKGLVVKNNLIDGFRYYGVYPMYQDSVEVNGNTIITGSNATTSYGIYAYYCDNETRIINNKIMINHGSYHYAMRIYFCDGTATRRGLVANNFISITAGTSTNYGIYYYYSRYFDVVYNSINITSGSSSSRGMYIYTPSSIYNVNILNNIFRDSVGYTIYGQSTTGVDSCDYNSYYSASNNFAYWGGVKSNLAALQTASGKDANSVTVDPQFISNTDLHMLSTQLSGLGLPIAAVTVDIDGEQRSLIGTTIGADEVPLLPYDIGVSEILMVPDTTNEGQNVTPKVVVKNYGTDTVVGYTISYQVNTATPVTQNVTDSLFTGMIDTIQLATFVSPAGMSQICANTVLAADSNAFNDGTCKNFFGIPAKDAWVTRIEDIPGGCGLTTDTVRIWVKNIGIDTINGSGQTTPTVSYKSNSAATVTENFTNVVVPGDSVQHVFQTAVNLATSSTADSTFNIAAWIDWTGDNVSYNDTAYASVFSAHVPPAPTVTSPVNVPYGSPATLTATSTDTVLWYLTDTSSQYFHMGGSYTTGFNYNDDTLWVAAMNGTADLKITETVQYKTGSGHTTYPSWFPSGDFDGLEITNMGSAPQDLTGWTVHLRGAQTINYTFPAGTVLNSGEVLTCVYGSSVSTNITHKMFAIATSTSVSSSSTVGYILKDNQGTVIDAFASNGYTFNAADGVTSADWSGSITGLGGQAGAIRLVSDNNNASDWGGSSSNTASFGTFNTQLQGSVGSGGNGCQSARVPIAIHVTGQLAADVGATMIIDPSSMLNLTSTENVKIKVRNFGTAAQSNIPVGYTVNNGAVVWDTITATLPAGDSLDFTFSTTADLSISGQTYNLAAFTDLNTPLDSNALNDTTFKSVTNLLPNYCTCASTSTGYEDLTGVSVGSWSYTNAATGANYTDYTSVSPVANIAPGTNYAVSISSGFPPGYSYAYTCYANMFIDFNRDGDFNDPGERAFGGSTNSSNTINGTISVPFNAAPGLTRMRIVLRESGTQSNTGPCGTFTWGEAEDYNIMIITPIAQDAGVEIISKPDPVNVNSVVPLIVQVRNFGTQMFDTVPVTYTLNGGAPVTVYHADTVLSMDSTIVNFGNITLQSGANTVCVYTQLPGDSNTFNDQTCAFPFLSATVSASYTDNFEGNNIWRKINGSQWERGVPQMTHINSAHSPVNAWAIDLDSTYANGSHDTLYTPYIVIPSFVDSAYLQFWNYYVTQTAGTNSDGGYVQYHISSTQFWVNLGYIGDVYATNWLNTNVGGTHMWTGNSNGWVQSKYRMLFTNLTNPFYNANGDTVQFRFIFRSGPSGNNYDGWAIDDFEVVLPPIPQDGGVIAITAPDTSSQVGSTVTVTIKVKNFGTQNLDTIPVQYDVNNSGNWVNETFIPSTPLLPGDTGIYTFNTTFTSPSNAYTLCAQTAIPGDVYTQNNNFCKSLSVTIAPIDGGITKVMITPVLPGTNGTDTTKASWTVMPSVYIKNFGGNAISNFKVEYKVGGNTWVTDTFTNTINSGDSVLYQFNNGYSSPLGLYTLKTRVVITGDADNTNDGKDMSLFGIIDVGMPDANGAGFYVKQNEPNPAKGAVRIDYFIPKGGIVKFEMRNTLGQVVISNEKDENAGKHSIKFDADKLPSGVYYYTVEFDGVRKTLKMIVNR